MAARARTFAHPQAAARIAEMVAGLASASSFQVKTADPSASLGMTKRCGGASMDGGAGLRRLSQQPI